MQHDDEHKITQLDDAKDARFVEKLCKENPALAAGYKPAETLVDWYLAGGYNHEEMLHAMAYSAAAQVFRDMPEEAEQQVRAVFESIVRELLKFGPHYGHEPY
jgi:hypothetical protein